MGKGMHVHERSQSKSKLVKANFKFLQLLGRSHLNQLYSLKAVDHFIDVVLPREYEYIKSIHYEEETQESVRKVKHRARDAAYKRKYYADRKQNR